MRQEKYYPLPLTERRLLVIAPHFDDETIGCGGALIQAAKLKSPACIAFATDGSCGDPDGYEKDIVAVRKKEASKANECYGADLHFWDLPEGKIRQNHQLLQHNFRNLNDSFQPDMIFLPSPWEATPDHLEMTQAILPEIARLQPDTDIVFYEVSAFLQINSFVNLTDIFDLKMKALKSYQSQIRYHDLPAMLQSQAYTRTALFPPRIKYAEAFQSVKAFYGKDFFDDVIRLRKSHQGLIFSPEKSFLKKISDGKIQRHIKHKLKVKALAENEKLLTSDFGRSTIRNKPKFLKTELTRRCNLRCKSCEHSYLPRNKEYHSQNLSPELFEKLIPFFGAAVSFYPFGYGEPMMNEHIMMMIERARHDFLNVGFNTNGTLFNRQNSLQLLKLEVNNITFSVDSVIKEKFEYLRSGAKFEQVINALRRFRDLKNRTNSPVPRLGIEVVVQKDNLCEIPEICWQAYELGCEYVFLENLVAFTPEMRDKIVSLSEKNELTDVLHRINDFSKQTGLSLIISPYLNKLAGENTPDEYPDKKSVRPSIPCREPWETVFVSWDGEVRPCCNSSRVLGNLNQQNLQEIWFGTEYRKFRQEFTDGEYDKYCRRCINEMRV